jgi:hypothetical protein
LAGLDGGGAGVVLWFQSCFGWDCCPGLCWAKAVAFLVLFPILQFVRGKVGMLASGELMVEEEWVVFLLLLWMTE